MIPAATVIIYSGIVLFVTAPFAWFASFAGKLMSVFISFVFDALDMLVRLPGAVWDRISIAPGMIFLLYLFIIFLIAFFLFRKFRALLPLAISILVIVGVWTYRNYQSLIQRKLIVYEDSKYAVADIIEGRKAFFVGDSSLFSSGKMQKYLLYPMETEFGIKEHQLLSRAGKMPGDFYFDDPYLFAGEYVVFHWTSRFQPSSDDGFPVPVDYLWLSELKDLSLLKYLPVMRPGCIVLGADVRGKYQKAVIKEAKSLNIELYSLKEQGYWQLNY